MVYIHFPVALTPEEEELRKRYAFLRKKRKALQALKALKPEREPTKENPVKRPAESAENAKEQAKKLIKSGAIKISDKNQEKKGFKRSRNLEKKLQDPEKAPASVAFQAFQPFSASHGGEDREEREDRPDHVDKPDRHDRRPRHPNARGLYDAFVRGEPGSHTEREREDRSRDREPRDREPPPKKGNTVYVFGHGITEDILKKALSNFGKIVNISMEGERNCGFVTFEKMDAADNAIQNVNGAMIDSVQLRVSLARRQPAFEPPADASTTSWASIASSNSQKGSHKDKREMVAYVEDMF